MAPRLLDLFCCAGGAAMGYHRAGFEVVGVDTLAQPNYPFEFHQADALDYLAKHGHEFDAVHASPPCQGYSTLNAYNHRQYPNLVAATRDELRGLGLPWIIENVPQAPLNEPIILCGAMFGLRVYRHRLFEASFSMPEPGHSAHIARCARNGYLPTPERPMMSIHGGKHSQAWRFSAAEAMEVPWTRTIREVCEAIPPAYTEFLGTELLAVLNAPRRRSLISAVQGRVTRDGCR